MKQIRLVVIVMVIGLLVSSCGAIPTLPSLDSTVTIKTPQFTVAPEPTEAEGQAVDQDSIESPLESPSAPPETIAVMPQPTERLIPTATLAPTEEPQVTAVIEATATPEPTLTPVTYRFTLQVMNPHYLGNFTHPELGCDWLGIGGQIFNTEGVVQKNIIIKVGGELSGSPVIEEMTMPLAEPDIDIAYGPGGYELTLGNAPAESDSTLWIQLFSLEGDPLSEKIYLVTYDDCQKNLLLMNFIE